MSLIITYDMYIIDVAGIMYVSFNEEVNLQFINTLNNVILYYIETRYLFKYT